TSHEWRVTGLNNKSGYFQLQIVAQGMTTFNVTANKLLSTKLDDEADVKIDDVPVSAPGNFIFYRDKPQTVTLIPKLGSPLAGLPVKLTCVVRVGLDPANVESDPKFNEERTTYSWAVTGNTKSGTFQLSLAGKDMTTPITLPISRLLSSNLADEATVLLDGVPMPQHGANFIGGKVSTLTLKLNPDGLLIGVPLAIKLVHLIDVEEREFACVPTNFGQHTTTHIWKLTGPVTKTATFSLKLFSKNEGGVLVTPRNRLGNESFRFQLSGAYLPLPPDVFRFQVNERFDVGVELKDARGTPIVGKTVRFGAPDHEGRAVATDSQGRASTPYTFITPGLRQILANVILEGRTVELHLRVNFI
ncbi:hypothetical protein PMI26_06173, partial [Pseudomonas sp. GM33]